MNDPTHPNPAHAPTCGDYGGRRKDGNPCKGPAIAGLKRCRMHAGTSLAKARAKGNVVLELRHWGLGDTHLDPGEVLLRLVSQSAARVEMYSRLLGEAYAAAERLREAHEAHQLLLTQSPDEMTTDTEDGEQVSEPPAVQAARADLDRIFNTGGVAALIGHRYDADRDGRIYPVDEAIRGLAHLEADERDRCANFATKAVAAGLAERQVRLAERQGAQMYAVFAKVLDGLGLSAEQRALVPQLLEREIRALTGAPVIEGSTR